MEELPDDLAFRNLDPEERALHDAVRSLPSNCRAVVHLCCFEGYDRKEIGKILHISRTAVQGHAEKGSEGTTRNRYNTMMESCHLTEEEKESMLKNVLAAKPQRKRPLLRLAAVAALAAVLIISAGAVASVATTGWQPGLPRFFTREEDITVSGSGGVAGFGEFLGGGSRGQTVLEWVNIRMEPHEGDFPTRTGGPEDGWTRMRSCPGSTEGEVDTYWQGDSLSGLAKVWDPGWDLSWVEETYGFQKGTGLLIQHIPAGAMDPSCARFVGEFRGAWGRNFTMMEYRYRKGAEPADSTILVYGDCEYWTTEDGVTAGIRWENTTWGRKWFRVSWSGPEVRFDMGGSGLSRDEVHQILNSLHLSDLSRQNA